MAPPQTLPDTTGNKPLTYGIEIEFILATLPSTEVDPEPDGRHVVGISAGAEDYSREARQIVYGHIANTFQQRGINAICGREAFGSMFVNPWLLEEDPSIGVPIKGNYKFYQTELISPVLYFSDQSLDQIRGVVEILTNQYRVHVNSTCGLQ